MKRHLSPGAKALAHQIYMAPPAYDTSATSSPLRRRPQGKRQVLSRRVSESLSRSSRRPTGLAVSLPWPECFISKRRTLECRQVRGMLRSPSSTLVTRLPVSPDRILPAPAALWSINRGADRGTGTPCLTRPSRRRDGAFAAPSSARSAAASQTTGRQAGRGISRSRTTARRASCSSARSASTILGSSGARFAAVAAVGANG